METTKPYIDAHRSGTIIWIDMMAVPERGQGVGRRYYERWEARLPKDITLIRLEAADAGYGMANGFWEAMGFDYVYTGDGMEGAEQEVKYAMWKGVNGHPTPDPIPLDDDDEIMEARARAIDTDLPRHLRPWLTGRCYDFALALSERMPDAEFVGIGRGKFPEHVGLRLGDRYYDARGEMDAAAFLGPHQGQQIVPVSRDVVELHAGVAGFPPPYRGNRDIAAARRAVQDIYGLSDG